MAEDKSSSISIEGIVARRDGQPYVVIFKGEERITQLSMAEARNIAHDLLTMCARTEADAMIHKYFSATQFPEEAGAAIMMEFREFRAKLDGEPVETFISTPSGDPKPD